MEEGEEGSAVREGGASLRSDSVMLPAQSMVLFASVIAKGKGDAYIGAVEGSIVQRSPR
jgi:hypothetical protein